MKFNPFKNAVGQSLMATVLCAIAIFGLSRFANWFKASSEMMLWPRAIASELKCSGPKLRLADNGNLKLLVEDDWSFDFYLYCLKEAKTLYGLSDLQAKALPQGEIELRVWGLPSFQPAYVFVLKKTQAHWKAALFGVPQSVFGGDQSEFHSHLGISWEAVWYRLVAEHILTLPEGSCLKNYYAVTDGIGYVVEINMAGVYRLYGYSNPEFQHELVEPKQMVKITCLVFPGYCAETIK